jgi:L-fucose mutarotase
MLYTKLTHPAILGALAAAGHGSRVLITDGNYPLSAQTPSGAERVYLNLSPGLVRVTDILEAVLTVIPIEAVQVMGPENGSEPDIFAEFRTFLPNSPLQAVGRFDFYALARQPDVVLAIASGDQRLYANILLTIGVVPPTPQE